MLTYKRESDINKYIEYLKKEKRDFVVRTSNSQKKVITDQKRNFGYSYRGYLSSDEMKKLWVYSAVKKEVLYYVNNADVLEFIGKRISPQRRNCQLYKELAVGYDFAGIDMNHAYWRMAYLKRYISYDLYAKLVTEEYKLVRNKSLACLTSKIRVETYEKGVLIKDIDEGDPVLLELYEDIRQSTYSLLEDIADRIGDEYFLKFHTDCLYVLPEKAEIVKEALISSNMLITPFKCLKVTDDCYLEMNTKKGEDSIKKF